MHIDGEKSQKVGVNQRCVVCNFWEFYQIISAVNQKMNSKLEYALKIFCYCPCFPGNATSVQLWAAKGFWWWCSFSWRKLQLCYNLTALSGKRHLQCTSGSSRDHRSSFSLGNIIIWGNWWNHASVPSTLLLWQELCSRNVRLISSWILQKLLAGSDD